MRGIVGLALATAALAACATGSASMSQETTLTVTYWENGPQGADPERWTLRCNPAGGTLARPARACSRLASTSPKLFAPNPPSLVCTQIYGGPQTARVTGKLKGKRVFASFSRTNGCEISRWNRLSPWLLPTGGAR